METLHARYVGHTESSGTEGELLRHCQWPFNSGRGASSNEAAELEQLAKEALNEQLASESPGLATPQGTGVA